MDVYDVKLKITCGTSVDNYPLPSTTISNSVSHEEEYDSFSLLSLQFSNYKISKKNNGICLLYRFRSVFMAAPVVCKTTRKQTAKILTFCHGAVMMNT